MDQLTVEDALAKLGLHEDAFESFEKIEDAYLQAIGKLHPDKNHDSREKFIEFSKLFEFLKKEYQKKNPIIKSTPSQDTPVAEQEIQLMLEEIYTGCSKMLNDPMVSVTIPPGIIGGKKIVRKLGNLTVQVLVRELPHLLFQKMPNKSPYDLMYIAKITRKEREQGFRMLVPFLDGTNVEIQHKGRLTEECLKMKNYGLPFPDGKDKRGNLYVYFDIFIGPCKDAKIEHALYLTMEDILGGFIVNGHPFTASTRMRDKASETETVPFFKLWHDIENGAIIRLPRVGYQCESEKKTLPKDVEYTINIVKHPLLKRIGPNLEYTAKITDKEALLGMGIELQIPTPEQEWLTISKSGFIDTKTACLVVSGKGLTNLNDATIRDDLIVRFEIAPQDEPIVHTVDVNFEDAMKEITKKFNIYRKIEQFDGSFQIEKKLFEIQIKPSDQTGKEFTFKREGDQDTGNVPADVMFVLCRKPPSLNEDEVHLDLPGVSTVNENNQLAASPISASTLSNSFSANLQCPVKSDTLCADEQGLFFEKNQLEIGEFNNPPFSYKDHVDKLIENSQISLPSIYNSELNVHQPPPWTAKLASLEKPENLKVEQSLHLEYESTINEKTTVSGNVRESSLSSHEKYPFHKIKLNEFSNETSDNGYNQVVEQNIIATMETTLPLEEITIGDNDSQTTDVSSFQSFLSTPNEFIVKLPLEAIYKGTTVDFPMGPQLYKVLVHPGTEEGQQLPYYLKSGNPVTGEKFFILKYEKHPHFKRYFLDIEFRVDEESISRKRTIRVPTLDGGVYEFKYKKSPKYGEIIQRYTGQGLPYKRDTTKRGDLIVRFLPEHPNIVSQMQLALRPLEYFLISRDVSVNCKIISNKRGTITENTDTKKITIKKGTLSGTPFWVKFKKSDPVLVIVREEAHEHFIRHGRDLLYTVDVDLNDFQQKGVSLKIPTLNKDETMDVNIGKSSSIDCQTPIRIIGKGLPDSVNMQVCGDIFVYINPA